MLPPGESRGVCTTRSIKVTKQAEQTDGRQTVTLRFPLGAASVIILLYAAVTIHDKEKKKNGILLFTLLISNNNNYSYYAQCVFTN